MVDDDASINRFLPTVRPESLCVTQLELLWYGERIGRATGFIYRFAQSYGLVTNWHVFSNKNAVTKTYLNADHKVPNSVRFVVCISKVLSRADDLSTTRLTIKEQELPLIVDGKSTWWQHFGYISEMGSIEHVDIGVLPLDQIVADLSEGEALAQLNANMIVSVDADDNPVQVDYAYVRAGAEVFIVGYPLGLTSQGVLPIWKRGSIASEPLAHLNNNLPAFLIDSVTRDGMSGAPVLYFGTDITGPDGISVANESLRSDQPWLLGIHAGSRGSSQAELEMTLSRAWKRPLIDEIFMHQISADDEITGKAPTYS